jgi:hypothetical protein
VGERGRQRDGLADVHERPADVEVRKTRKNQPATELPVAVSPTGKDCGCGC